MDMPHPPREDPLADPDPRSASKSSSPPKRSVSWSPDLTALHYQHSSSAVAPSALSRQSSNLSDRDWVLMEVLVRFCDIADTMSSVRDALGRWRQKVGEATRKAEDLAGNVWQHLKTGPSITDAAMGRLAQGTKVLAEGGYEKIFRQTFDTISDEQLENTYACYLSTSAGPVMGIMYLSTAKVAFCSDNPLPYRSGNQTEWSYYKVIIPLHQLKAVNPSVNKSNPSEKYIQVISVDNHEFWFMGFVNYEGAVGNLQEALLGRTSHVV